MARLTLGLFGRGLLSLAYAGIRVATPSPAMSNARRYIAVFYNVCMEKDKYILTKQYAVTAAQAQAAQRQACSAGEEVMRGVSVKYAVTNPVARPPICAALSTRK